MLNQAIFRQIVAIYGLPDLDLFAKSPGKKICILDRRSKGPSQWGGGGGGGAVNVCLPCFQPNPEVPTKGDRGESPDSSCGFSMEIETMVSNIIRPSYGSTMSTSTRSPLSSSTLGESTVPYSQSPQFQVSHVTNIRQSLLLASWEKQYESAWKQFCRWCQKKSVNPFSCPLDSILLYLSDLYEKGLQHRTINSHRSAISATHLPINNVCIGAHPMVSRLMKGIFILRSAVPKYIKT